MKKGFTLVELLAVIIILGILSVLIVPKIVNTINESEQKTNIASAKNLLKSAEYKYQDNEILGINEMITIDFQTGQNIDKLDYSGNKPESGKINIRPDGEISMAVKIGDKCYTKQIYENDINVQNYSNETCIIESYIKLVGSPIENGKISVGDEYRIGNEHFNVIGIEGEKISLIAKYNLLVGNYDIFEEDDSFLEHGTVYSFIDKYKDDSIQEDPYGKQNLITTAGHNIGIGDYYPCYIMIYNPFSSTSYWNNTSGTYPKDVYNEKYNTSPENANNNNVYSAAYYIQNYIQYLRQLGAPQNIKGRIPTLEDFTTKNNWCSEEEKSECNNSSTNYCCTRIPNWIEENAYFWLSTAHSDDNIYDFVYNPYDPNPYIGTSCRSCGGNGTRAVIEVPTYDLIQN